MPLVIQNNNLSTGFAESFIQMRVPSNFEYTRIISYVADEKEFTTLELMSISEKSLAKDWEDEDDEYWNSL